MDADDQPLLAGAMREHGVEMVASGASVRPGDAARSYEQELEQDKEDARRDTEARRAAKGRAVGNALMRVGGLKLLMRMPNWMIGGEEARRDHWVTAQERALRRARGLLALQQEQVNGLVERKNATVAVMEARVRALARSGTRDSALMEVKRLAQMRGSLNVTLKQSMFVQSQLDDIEKLMSGITTMATRASVVSALAETFSASPELQAFTARLTQATEDMAFVKQTFARDMEDATQQMEADAANAVVDTAEPLDLLPASNAPGLVSEQERPALERELARVLAGGDRGAGAMLAT